MAKLHLHHWTNAWIQHTAAAVCDTKRECVNAAVLVCRHGYRWYIGDIVCCWAGVLRQAGRARLVRQLSYILGYERTLIYHTDCIAIRWLPYAVRDTQPMQTKCVPFPVIARGIGRSRAALLYKWSVVRRRIASRVHDSITGLLCVRAFLSSSPLLSLPNFTGTIDLPS